MMSFLPDPKEPKFPDQAVGMHVLLDQAPALFRSIGTRWTSCFGRVVMKLYEQIHGLNRSLWPWRHTQGSAARLDHWICVMMQCNATVIHQKSVRRQGLSKGHAEWDRQMAELHTSHFDFIKADLRMDVCSLVALTIGINLDHELFHEAVSCLLMVNDAYEPISDQLEEHPYRDGSEWRVSTEQMLRWIKESYPHTEATPDVAKLVKEDIEAGRWTPLGEGADAGGLGGVVIEGSEGPGEDISSETSLQIDVRLGEPEREILEGLRRTES